MSVGVPLRSLLAAVLLLTACSSDSSRLIDRAEARWREGKYDEAIRLNRLAHDRDKQGRYAPEALLKVGDIYYLNLRRINDAVETYKQLLNEFPGKPEEYKARERLANIYENEMGDLTQAIYEYDKILEATSLDNRTEIQFQRANAYFKKQDFDRALRELRRMEEAGVDGHLAHQIYLKIGNIYQIRKRFEDAIAYFKKVTESPCPECRRQSILNLSESYEALYDFKNAIEAIHMLDQTPEDALLVQRESRRLMEKERHLNSGDLKWQPHASTNLKPRVRAAR
jgi:tetratricopeptide (TPR) repeat protein